MNTTESKVVWSEEREFGDVKIKAAKTGYVIEKNSRYSGSWTGTSILIKYCKDFPAGQKLDNPWNKYMIYAEELEQRADDYLSQSRAYRGEVSRRPLPYRVMRYGEQVF